jgi:hypothetical protein
MKNQFFTLSFFALLVATLPNCGKYEPSTFRTPYEQPQEKKGVSVQTHRLSKDEYREYFTPKKQLLGKDPVLHHFVPIQLLITNNTNKTYILSGNNIAARLEMKQNIANKMHHTSMVFSDNPDEKRRDRDRVKSINKQINRDVDARVIDSNDEIKVRPGTRVNKVFFIYKRSFYSPIAIKLIDKKNEKPIIFDVYL